MNYEFKIKIWPARPSIFSNQWNYTVEVLHGQRGEKGAWWEALLGDRGVSGREVVVKRIKFGVNTWIANQNQGFEGTIKHAG